MKRLRTISFTPLLYVLLILGVLFFSIGHFNGLLFSLGRIWVLVIAVVLVTDALLLFLSIPTFPAIREVPERLSNGDDNEIRIHLHNRYFFPVKLKLVDELPFQFQERDFAIPVFLKRNEEKTIRYTLKPVYRGEYHFGQVCLAVRGPLRLVVRHFREDEPWMVPVYPSFLQMRRFEIMAISNRLYETGIKRIRRTGRQFEFDQIREYVKGDDYRTVNWKATALKARLMVNQYQDEKSQAVYSIIDMGRSMKMPFGGMSLLDYAINSSLVISNTALNKYDKAGLIAFNDKITAVLPAERKNSQMQKILGILYNLETGFAEPDYEMIYAFIRRRIRQRSLLIFYTNMESLAGMQRYAGIFGKLAREHVVLTVLFENTEISSLLQKDSRSLDDIYVKTIAEKLLHEKRLIAHELMRVGVYAVLTKPEALSVNLINKYLEFKARGVI